MSGDSVRSRGFFDCVRNLVKFGKVKFGKILKFGNGINLEDNFPRDVRKNEKNEKNRRWLDPRGFSVGFSTIFKIYTLGLGKTVELDGLAVTP